ncbi:protein translocase subunit SecD, partial [Puerhibacterium puerhi]|uniref:protein translocase subunit SecD n=1 Tax=Puerhibacterium puerhi TaxID=2692623 RepID=UPI001359E69F
MVLTILLPIAGLVVGTQLDGRTTENPAGASLTPGLALDLEGGTQIILTPTTTDGSRVTDETVNEAINVIRQRIDSSGVTEAEITSQGGANIVVGIPGRPSQETVDLVSQAAQMRFRPVLTYGMGTPTPQPSASGDAAASPEPSASAEASPAPSASQSAGSSPAGKSAAGTVPAPAPAAADPSASPSPSPSPSGDTGTAAADPSDLAQITPEIQEQFQNLDCTDPANLKGGGGDDPDAVLVTCSTDGTTKWILGPVELEGTHIRNATSGLVAGPNGVTTNEWGVMLDFDSTGARQFSDTTTRLNSLESPRNQFAIVLDGLVVSAPSITNGPITNGQAQITGQFTRDSAATLANQLSFGALPITFEVQSQQEISATLGSEQLRNGLVAGLIGLLLVVVYSLFQYRTLGLLTVASLVVAGLITYATIALLSWGMGYRLSLAGVAGLIVAIGFTADSFIVYFERIRDELRNGRSLQYAVERGWRRARRTIYAAKAVNLISAIILYYLAVGGVQGFAFTLGLTTVIDVAVVVWFTHPMMELIARMRFFRDGHALSGLSRERLMISAAKPRYVGAGRVAMPETVAQDVAAEVDPDEGAQGEPALVGAGTGR